MAGLLPFDRQFPGLVDPVNITSQLGTFYASTIYPWSEPVRVRIDSRLKVVLGTTGLIAPNSPPGFFIDAFESRWHYPWSEPVRTKPRLHAALNPVTAYTNISPLPNPVLSRWLMPLTEPVRLKKGIGRHLQQTLAIPTRIVPVVNVFITISATETNGDVFLGAMRALTLGPPVKIRVSIREMDVPSGGNLSIEET